MPAGMSGTSGNAQRAGMPAQIHPQFWNPMFNPSSSRGGMETTLYGGQGGQGGGVGMGAGRGGRGGGQQYSSSTPTPNTGGYVGAQPVGGWGSGGGGLPSYDEQRLGFANPPPMSGTTAINPLQQQGFDNTQSAFGNAQNFNRDIMSLQNEQNVQALQNARDLVSGMTAEAEQGGIARGGVGSGAADLLRRQSLDTGLRSTHKLQGELVGEGLKAKNAAMANEIGAAGGTASAANMAANTQSNLHLGMLAAQNASQRTLMDRAESQARMNEAPYQRLSSMMDLVGRNRANYSGLGSGGSSGLRAGSVGMGPRRRG